MNKPVLFVVGNSAPGRLPGPGGGGEAHLLPLTDDWLLVSRWERSLAPRASRVRVLPAGRLFDDRVALLRERLGPWSAALGARAVGGKPLREELSFSGTRVSAWWFSLLSERNPLKTDVFFKVAQLLAVEELLASGTYGQIVPATADRTMNAALEAMARRHGLGVERAPGPWAGRWTTAWVKQRIREGGRFLQTVDAFRRLARWWAESRCLRRAMASASRRPFEVGALVFVTYFPFLDFEAAGRGRFVNRFAGPLQGLMDRLGIPVHWVWMVVPVEGVGVAGAARLGTALGGGGTAGHFLLEFLTGGVLRKALADWYHLRRRARRVLRSLPPPALSAGLGPPEAEPWLRILWRQSFFGWVALEGALYYRMFEKAFKSLSPASACLYFAEMQSWEKALNAARRSVPLPVPAVAFQHAAVSRNHFFYAPDPAELADAGKPFGHPFPDVFAVNGERARGALEALGGSRVRRLEAVRQLGLAGASARSFSEKRRPPAVLLVGSYDATETAALLALFQRAFPGTPPFPVGWRPHPSTNARALVREAGGAWAEWAARLRTEPLEDLLAESTVVIGGETSAVVEALAFGCRVVAPVLNRSVFLSPLDGHETVYKKVYGPVEFGTTVLAELQRPRDGAEELAWRRFVDQTWDLNAEMPRWKRLLEELGTPHGPAKIQ